jgi:hypothetical protein
VDLTLTTKLTGAISFHYDLSLDGGVTWVDMGGAGLDLSKAGFTVNALNQYLDSQGKVATETGMVIPLPDPTNPNRQVRGTVTVSETITTKVTITVS